jgi:hypothetical protein
MTERYLLPCRCGQTVPVERGQAGQTVHCRCGGSLEVPTLLAMARLEPELRQQGESEAGQPWGVWQGMAVAGLVVCGIAAALAGYLAWTWPPPPLSKYNYANQRAWIAERKPAESLEIFLQMRREGLAPLHPAVAAGYAAARFHYQLGAASVALLAAAGVALALAGFSRAVRVRAAAGPRRPSR